MRTLIHPTRRARPSCSVIALATVLVIGASPAAAQSFQGTGTFVTNTGGSAAITTPNASTTNISVNSGQTVINWSPFDTATSPNPINFQNAGTTATFSGSGSYAVLNRINPVDSTRAISMNGTIMATSLGVAVAGAGSIYFYSPGGFVIGANAVINVGSLVLSASPITLDVNGNFINGANRQVIFGQAPNAGAQISVNSGAQINALASGSYVAMVAPSVIHNGAITVDGSAALVAAEAATISFSPNGLFDIQVDAGTTSTFGISTVGDIGGPASGGAGDNHRIYMVAVPKNQALTMVIGAGADLGFNVAGAANVDGNAIILSAGHDIIGGAAGAARSAGGGSGAASINAFNFNATSALNGIATFDLKMGATSGTSTFHSDINLKGVNEVFLSAGSAGALLTVKGDVSLSVDRTIGAGTSGSAGLAAFYATNGGSLIAEKKVTVTADASGAGSSTAGVAGGNATGGKAYVQAQSGGSLTVGGAVTISADGTGGDALVAGAGGGSGTGGIIQLQTFDTGSTVSVAGSVFASANGTGGSSSASGSSGGTGQGGTMYIGARSTDAQFTVGGMLFADADGQGGYANGAGVNGGMGRGGSIFIEASSSGAKTNLNGGADVSAGGYGGDAGGEGCSTCDSAGGAGLGGTIQFSTSAGAAGTALTVNGDINASTEGRGGFGITNGGAGTGGLTSSTFAAGSAILLNGDVDFSARGYGGDGADDNGGAGTGGTVKLGSQTGAINGSLTVTGDVYADVSGYGGDAYGPGAGGLGRGGLTDNGGSAGTVDFQGDFRGYANGYGGYAYDGIGGAGIGGNGWVDAFGATIHIGGDYAMDTSAYGGSGTTGGNATGGNSYLAASSALTLDGSAYLSSSGFGGYGFGGNGGSGTGGFANVRATNGATLAAGSSVSAYATGFGGNVGGGGEGTGGTGTGGQVLIQANSGGTLDIGGYVYGEADGFGGSSFGGGNGGDGFGGASARIEAVDGDILIAGWASITADGYGGNGLNGGNGRGSGTPATNTQPGVGGAHIFARNGDITIGDGAYVSAAGYGGDSGYDYGEQFFGDFTAFSAGGNGGDGTGGWASIHAANSNLGPSSIIISSSVAEGSGSAEVNVDGIGGSGGAGESGDNGGNGGNGGIGTGGAGFITASAGNGLVTIDDAYVHAFGIGGNGGSGGYAYGEIESIGGNGGNGGAGIGGNINVGTESGNGQSAGVNNGVANFGTLTADASAWGGAGGDGNFGATNGNGGDGGDAIGGNAVLLVRGSTVNVDKATLTADAHGGDAGFGYVPEGGTPGITGIGGDATVGGGGGIGVLVTGRFLIPAQRGTLNAGNISGTAIAAGGIGIPDGNSTSLGGSGVFFLNADGNIGSLDFVIGVGSNASTSGVDSISVINGDVIVDGEFSFVTSGNLSLFANNGDMHAGTLTLSAGDFVFDPVNDPPSDRGTYFADSATITTGNNFVTSANLDIGSDLEIIAPGLINAQKFTIDGDLDLWAQGGGITATILDVFGRADLTATGSILLTSASAGFFHAEAGGSFTSGDITSDSNIQIFTGDDVTLGELVAGPTTDINSNKAIRIITNGSVLVGNILAAGGIDITALGSVTGGNVTTGGSFFTDALGAIIYGDVSAGLVNPQPPSEPFSVGLVSGTSIAVGNVDATRGIAFVTPGALTAGSLTTGTDVLGLVLGNMIIGNINAGGRVLLANYSMYTDAGGTIPTSDGFDTEPVFNATPVATGGSILLGGPVTAGDFTAAAGTTLTGTTIDATGAIYATSGGTMTLTNLDADSDIFLRSGGQLNANAVNAGGFIDARSASAMTLGNLVADDYIDLRSNGAISLLNATSGETISFLTQGSLTGLSFTAGNSVLGQAMGAIQLGAISAGIVDPSSASGAAYAVRLASNAAITTGAVNALGNIGFGTPTTLTTGNLTSGGGILALVGGNMSLGTILTGDAGYVYLADYSMSALGGAFETFNRAPILAATPVATGGSILLGGPVTTGDFTAAAGTTLTGTTIDAAGAIYATSGGNMTLTGLDAGGHVALNSGGTISTGTIDAGDFVDMFAVGNISSGNINAGSDIDIFSNSGSLNLANLVAGSQIDLETVGAITFANVSADDFNFEAGGAVTGQNITVITHADGHADGALKLGNIIVSGPPSENNFSVGFTSATSIEVGNVNGYENVGFATFGDLTTGNLTAGNLIMTLAGGNIVTGSITTPASGQVYMAHGSMFETGGGGGDGDFDESIVLALNPIPTGGSISINGPVTTGTFRAAAGDDLTTRAITANSIDAFAGGTGQIDGLWTAANVRLASNDINITANGGIDGGSSGQITLNSINPDGMLVGDGLTGSGYALSNAEFGRISGGYITIIAGGYAGAAADTLIGNLTITGPLAGSNVESSDGGVEFITLSESGTELDGTLRVVGEVVATGFGADNYLSFQTEHFQLDAGTGLISITSSGTTLSGILELVATDIFVASADILAKLETDPKYSGYVAELNAPAAVQRPDGVIRAAAIDISGGAEGLTAILVQNTGTVETPAGFLLNAANIGGEGSGGAAGSIDLVINGQIVTPAGIITGIDVRDLLVSEFGTADFTATSTINGCALVGPCLAVIPPPPPPPPPQVNLVNRTDVQLNTGDILGDSPGEGNSSSNPIGTPVPLFDSSPLAQSGDITDPVSGAGNPSLYGIHSDDDEDEEDEEDGSGKPVKENATGDGQ